MANAPSKKEEVLLRLNDFGEIIKTMEISGIQGSLKLTYSTADGDGDFELVAGKAVRPVEASHG